MSALDFSYDLFLSHSAKDKAVVRASSLSASIPFSASDGEKVAKPDEVSSESGERAGVRCRNFHLAERLQVAVRQHLKVWFDEWVLKPGDGILAKIEEGLKQFDVGFRISDMRSPACRPMRSARIPTGRDWRRARSGFGKTAGRRNHCPVSADSVEFN